MTKDFLDESKDQVEDLITFQTFSRWTTLDDMIMGGSSCSICKVCSSGLLLEGNVVEKNGGFVSCRSELFQPKLDLSRFSGIQLKVDAHGKTLKFAITSSNTLFGFSRFIPRGLKWVSTFSTKSSGTTIKRIAFNQLQPNVRASKISLPIAFNKRAITRFHLLYSKFGISGEMNKDFNDGKIQILVRSISAYY